MTVEPEAQEPVCHVINFGLGHARDWDSNLKPVVYSPSTSSVGKGDNKWERKADLNITTVDTINNMTVMCSNIL